MIAEVYDALREAGASEEKARRAAEVLLKFVEPEDLEIRLERLERRLDTLTWMVGANITLTILVLGKLLVA